jgi:hypothetical protein
LSANARTLDLDDITAQIRAGKAEQVYQLLLKFEGRYAGRIRFDYLLGLAALESGRPADATYALERVLTVNPDFPGARLDMARAYYELGQDDLALSEFKELRKLDPPPAARRAVDTYVAAIERRNETTQFSYFVSSEIGYDSNINGAQNRRIVPTGTLLDLTLADKNTTQNDASIRAEVGATMTHEFTPALTFQGTASVNTTQYLSTDGFESNTLSVGTSLDYTRGGDRYTFGVNLAHKSLDWFSYQNIFSMSAGWQRALTPQFKVLGFGVHLRTRHTQSANRSVDADLTQGGFGLEYALDKDGSTVMSAIASVGIDSERTARTDGSSEIMSLGINAQHRFKPNLEGFISNSLSWTLFDRVNALFRVRRTDLKLNSSLGMRWRPAERWTVTPSVQYARSVSNIVTSDSKRLAGMLQLRYDF